jgi:tetratricopeptide (TPR) repeat protein
LAGFAVPGELCAKRCFFLAEIYVAQSSLRTAEIAKQPPYWLDCCWFPCGISRRIFSSEMTLDLNLTKLSARFLIAAGVLVCCSLLLIVVVSRFVVGTLSDDRLLVTRDTLRVPVEYFPGSARLNARLAAAELAEGDRDLASAESYAARAVSLSPNDYRFRLTLASAQEANGNRAAAEESLRAALTLAPNYWDVHYRLGNLLVRQGRLEAITELRTAVAANHELLPVTLDLIWRVSRGDAGAVRAISGNAASARLTLAQFLLKVERPVEAAEVFGSIDRSDKLASAKESAAVLNALTAAGKLEVARSLWSELAGRDDQSMIISNGSFESDILRDFSQFDWSFARSEYATLAIDAATARTGSRSLRIEFAGRDTTRLDNEIKQLVPVRPGARYTLECYFKSSGFESPEGPRVVVTDSASANWVAASEPLARGSRDWQRLTVDFVAPQSVNNRAPGVFVSIKRKPRFSYDDPTRGTLWFDDFSIKEQ